MTKTLTTAVVIALALGGLSATGAAEDDHAHEGATKPVGASATTAAHDDHAHDGDHAHKSSTKPAKAAAHDHDHDHGPTTKPAAAAAHDDHDHDHGAATKPGSKDEHGHDHAAGAKPGGDGHDHGHGGHADEVKLTPEAVRNHGIRVAPVKKQTLAGTFVAPARVAYNAEAVAHVGSLVKGRAAEIKVSRGDLVKKGGELLVVESPELGEAQSDYLQRITAVGVANAAVEPARRAAERATKLYDKSQGVALAEVQRRESELKAAEGAVLTAQASLDAAKHKLYLMGVDEPALDALTRTKQLNARYTVHAPIAGTVIEREVTLGELVSAEKEALLVVADLTSVWVLADVPEAKLEQLTVGSPARVLVAAGGAAFEGKVSYIAPSLDPGTRTAQVRIVVPNSKGSLRPGMFARAEISTGPATGAAPVLAIPESAVQTVEGKASVFVPVEGEPNTFAARAVKLGRLAGGMVAVESGLKEGEQVVVNGTFILKADLGKAGAAHEH
jgi:cobalt-zinc-cadmium efflux system membrane fusion protein